MNNKIKMLTLVMLMIFAVACSGEEESNTSDDPLKAYSGTTLNLLLQTGYDTSAVTSYQSDFEEMTGIELNIEIVDEPTLRKKFVLDSTSHTGNYDVVSLPFWFMPEYLEGEYLEPLDDYIENEQSELFSVNDIPDNLLESYQNQEEDLYAIPVNTAGGVLMYRTDLFEEYDIEIPRTTKDVLQAAEELKEKLPNDIIPFVGRGSSETSTFGSPAGWGAAYGASILNSDGEVTANSDAMNEAMNDWVTLLRDYGPEDAAAMGWESMSQIFMQGKAAMNYDMSGFLSTYSNTEDSTVAEKFDATVLEGPAGDKAQWTFGQGYGINADSESKGASWLFLQWRSSLMVAEKEVEDDLRVDFPLTSIYETDIYKENSDKFGDLIPEITESIDDEYWPSVNQFENVSQDFVTEISLSITGDQEVETSLDKIQKKLEETLE